jgi:hypothetical protein
MSPSVVHRLESGRTREAKRDTLDRIARAFGMTSRQLIDAVPKDPLELVAPVLPAAGASARKEIHKSRAARGT